MTRDQYIEEMAKAACLGFWGDGDIDTWDDASPLERTRWFVATKAALRRAAELEVPEAVVETVERYVCCIHGCETDENRLIQAVLRAMGEP